MTSLRYGVHLANDELLVFTVVTHHLVKLTQMRSQKRTENRQGNDVGQQRERLQVL
jgi:hypothetical protein